MPHTHSHTHTYMYSHSMIQPSLFYGCFGIRHSTHTHTIILTHENLGCCYLMLLLLLVDGVQSGLQCTVTKTMLLNILDLHYCRFEVSLCIALCSSVIENSYVYLHIYILRCRGFYSTAKKKVTNSNNQGQ